MRSIQRTIICGAALLGGCITHPQNPAATQPVTNLDLATTQPSYWLDRPAEATARSADFDRLWSACEQTARDYLFQLDREDQRAGVLTTKPLVSSQWFEIWRPDVKTLHDAEESSTATIRRTIEFQFKRSSDGGFEVVPKVIVERHTIAEKRITSVTTYRGLFDASRDPHDNPSGTVESDEGVLLRPRYWYALGRDPELERSLADSVAKKMRR